MRSSVHKRLSGPGRRAILFIHGQLDLIANFQLHTARFSVLGKDLSDPGQLDLIATFNLYSGESFSSQVISRISLAYEQYTP